ncbi:hypothetical protein AB0D38_44730, partial [Streptomyces sp. NPDC048279]|uniref:hypothetical protein n=1 Tax=Streptomyces sp. NPDC048279 TaxID=3154714 RepID=UPI00343C5825
MTFPVRAVDLIMCVTPFGEPDHRLTAAVCASGGLGVLDLGRGDRRTREALARLKRAVRAPYGVRVAPGCGLTPEDLDELPDTVVLAADAPWSAGRL